MKYSNGRNHKIKENWYKVRAFQYIYKTDGYTDYYFEIRPKMVKWIKEYDSDGLFYFYHASESIWFEREKDAVAFSLVWL